jgi:hypothetical protein
MKPERQPCSRECTIHDIGQRSPEADQGAVRACRPTL